MKLTVKPDKKGKWRWTLRAKNGVIIGASTQGYRREVDCMKNIDQVAEGLSTPDGDRQ